MRLLADLPDDDVKWLNRKAASERRPRAALIREAVAAYRSQASKDAIDAAFGLWKERTDIGDAVEWQRRERATWTRPWDHDYDEVRA